MDILLLSSVLELGAESVSLVTSAGSTSSRPHVDPSAGRRIFEGCIHAQVPVLLSLEGDDGRSKWSKVTADRCDQHYLL